MITRGVKRKLSIFAVLCVLIMEFNVGFSINEQSSSQSGLKNLSVTQEYTTPVTKATESVFSTFESTPVPTITSTPTVGENDDYGNDISNAFTISKDITTSGKLSYFDPADVFCFSTSSEVDTIVTIISNNPHIEASVLDFAGNRIATQKSQYVTLSFHALKDMNYYVELKNLYQNSVDYTVNVTYMIDDYSDDLSSAKEVSIGQAVTGNLISNEDVDCFKLTFVKKGIYNINSNYNFIKYNYKIEIFDDSGSNIPIETPYTKKYFSLDANKTYYVKISRDPSNHNIYTYNFQINGPIIDDFRNSFESAHEIQMDKEVKGNVNYFYDKDLFCFTPPADGAYCIDNFTTSCWDCITFDLPYLNSVFKAFDSNENELRLYYDYDTEKGYLYLSKGKKYYISLSNVDRYSLFDYSFILNGPIEDDLGNTIESAREIDLNEQVEGTASYVCDYDFFSFKPSEDGAYYIEDFIGEVDYNYYHRAPSVTDVLRVYDSNNIDISTYQYDCYSRGHFDLAKGHTYYICISNGAEPKTFKYSFKLKGPISDDYGNTKEASHEILLDTKVEGKTTYYFDSDFFSFVPTHDGMYYLDNYTSTDKTYGGLGYALKITDENDKKLETTYYNSRAYFNLSKDTTYYISITNCDYSSTFSYSFVLKGPIIDDYGDTKESAREIQIGSTVNGYANIYDDCDYFSFTPKNDGMYFLDDIIISDDVYIKDAFKFLDKSGDLTNVLYKNSKVYFYLTKDTTYYISIKNYNYYEPFSYSFKLKGPIEDDYSNTKELTQEIKLDTKVEGKINYYNDNDYFSFKPSEDAIYYIDDYVMSDKNSSYFYYVLKAFDKYGSPIDINYYKSKIYFKLTKDTTYYFCISDFDYYAPFSYSFVLKGPIIDDFENTIDKLEDKYRISGYIKPDFEVNSSSTVRAGFKVSLEGTQLSAVTDEYGYFEILNVPSSDTGYTIEITKDNYLKREFKNVIVDGDVYISKSKSPIEMWVGDMIESKDGAINIADIFQIAKVFNSSKGDSRYSARMDVDENSVINMADVIIIAKHFNETADSYMQVVKV